MILNLASIFSAEFLAIIVAIDTVNQVDGRKFKIFTDSKSVLKSATNLISKDFPPLILHFRSKLLSARSKEKNIYLTWIPSHIRLFGNDMADSDAKKAAKEDPLLNTVQTTLREETHRETTSHWHKEGSEMFSKLL